MKMVISFLPMFFLAINGCSSSGSKPEPDDNSSLKKHGESAWQAVGLAMNITNPTYYAKKIAQRSYSEVKGNNNE